MAAPFGMSGAESPGVGACIPQSRFCRRGRMGKLGSLGQEPLDWAGVSLDNKATRCAQVSPGIAFYVTGVDPHGPIAGVAAAGIVLPGEPNQSNS